MTPEQKQAFLDRWSQGQTVYRMKEESCNAEQIADQCRQLGLFRERVGNCSEQLWYAAVAIAAYCGDGREFAHSYAGGFDPDETDDAIEFAQDHPPTTCERFQKLNPQGCEGCPHKGQLTSPVQLGRTTGVQKAPRQHGHRHLGLSTKIETQARPPRTIIPDELRPQINALIQDLNQCHRDFCALLKRPELGCSEREQDALSTHFQRMMRLVLEIIREN